MARPTPKRVHHKKAFRGHHHFRKAHQQILAHPLQTGRDYFATRDFSDDQLFWVIEAASARGSSISIMARRIRERWNNCPSGESVLATLRAIPETEVEAVANELLLGQYQALPAEMRDELERAGIAIFDYHADPYWGDPRKVDVCKGQKEHDSYYHFEYLTVDLLSERFRFTIYVTPRVQGFPTVSYVQPALDHLRQYLPVRLVLFDGEFPTVDVLEFLEREAIPWVARKSQTKAVKEEFWGYYLDPAQFLHPRWHVVEITSGSSGKKIAIHVAACLDHGKVKVVTKPIWHSCPVEEAIRTYRKRFAIDSGYKEKHAFQAVTSTRSWAVRLLLFVISVLLWNTWRLALAWCSLHGTSLLAPLSGLEITRNAVTHEIGEYLVNGWWKI